MIPPNLLFISPEYPSPTGGGSPMRARVMLEALAENHKLYLFVVPIIERTLAEDTVRSVSKLCARVVVCAGAPKQSVASHCSLPKRARKHLAVASPRAAAGAFGEVHFEKLHVYRLYMAPFADVYLRMKRQERPFSVLDLDDYESKATRRIAELYSATGDTLRGAAELEESSRYAAMEQRYLPLFDRIQVSSEQDRIEISREYGCPDVRVIPNAVRIPAALPEAGAGGPFTLLFLGTMNHYPNEDAVQFFCAEMLPQLRRESPRPFRLVIAGISPTPGVLALARNPEVTVTGEVGDVGECYCGADAVVAPLRAGGGTRIKILEALSYRRPVLSTAIGAEGLDVADGEQILIANTPAEFVRKCLLLMNNPSLGRDLANRGFQWVSSHHTLEQVKERLRE